MTASPLIRIEMKELEVYYKDLAAFSADGVVLNGTVIAILGHNGAGKSTLIKTILRLLTPRRGTIRASFLTEERAALLIPEEHMAFCPETGSVFTDISVESYLKIWCRVKYKNAQYYRREGSRYIETLQLEPLLGKLGRELSKGQRRRVQTAIGFLLNPRLFLFDEPFDGLDVQRTHELNDLIKLHSTRMGFILSSHRMDVVERLADYIVVLSEGGILCYGSVDQVTERLSGATLLLTLGESADNAQELLQSRFPSCVINRIGSRLSLTGEQLPRDEILQLLSGSKVPIGAVEVIRPSLVDAMTYHLKNQAK